MTKTGKDKPIIQFDQVTKQFPVKQGTITVLRGIQGDIPKGVILTLLGPSGSGKSTLLSLCNLLLTPDSGRVIVQDKDVREWDISELRRSVGMVFQTPTLLPGTVSDNLTIGAKLHGQRLDYPEQYLRQVGLSEDLLTRDAQDLSGGQKQRVALARTLVTKPSVLLLDEVTSALEPATVREIEELIKRIQQEQKTTILWVTHDLAQAERVGDIAWLLVDGKLTEASDTKMFFSNPQKEATRRFLKSERTGGDTK